MPAVSRVSNKLGEEMYYIMAHGEPMTHMEAARKFARSPTSWFPLNLEPNRIPPENPVIRFQVASVMASWLGFGIWVDGK